ncbi:MAG: TMEM165/GDT1 family protein [Cyanobacteria bacterium J06560_2]
MTSSDSASPKKKKKEQKKEQTAETEAVLTTNSALKSLETAPDLAGFWPVFLSTFITIFLAELGDKTQVTTMLMSAESQAPITVFLGAGLALISTSLIGVLLGQWLSSRVSEETLDICAGILLLLITIALVGDIFSS